MLDGAMRIKILGVMKALQYVVSRSYSGSNLIEGIEFALLDR